MKMKRFLAILLVLAMCLTTLGVVPAMAVEPAAEESDDAISARWTDKNSLSPADQEITPHEVEGEIPSADGVDLSNDENALKASDIVTVIVELESEPLADAAMGELDTFISSPAGLQLEQDLLNEQASVRAEIEALTGKTETASVNGASDLTYSYTTVLNGFSMKLPYGKLDEVRSLNGVKNVWVAEQYSLPEDLSADDYTISMSSSTGMVGSTEANAMGYDGTGTIVAILDTGFMKAHEAFSVMPTNTKYSKDDIASLLQSQSLASKVTDADSVYINEKAPYGYDYANGDADPEAVGQAHGVHVAGTVAGNNGKDFHGVAPNAQLMIMKIFGDGSGSTSDDIILAGVDDSVKLGADSINMSLGSPAGFTDYGDENESEEENLTYYGVYTRAEKAGVNVLVAAGNETSSTNYNAHNNLTYAEYPDNAIVASPSTLEASLSVASVDNVKSTSYYMLLGEEKLAYNNAVNSASSTPYDILDTMDGKTLEYVMVPGLGEEADYEGLDVTGKIAVVQRGGLNFGTKAENASKAGAAACIIYDNVNGAIINAALESFFIPTVTVTKIAGAKLAAASEKKVSFSKEYYGLVDNPVGGGVSSFSSKGPAPDLTIKPEISAPGGGIRSSVLGAADAYEVYSGTSMATPHMAGEAALLRQYLNKNYPNITGEDLGDLVNSLLMSTAVPSVEPDGTYYPVRRQGAGVANIANAIESGAYLSVEGSKRPKAEVGSSKDGVYTYTATVHNMTGEAKSYTVDTTAMIETITVINGENFASNSNRDLTADEVTITYTGLTADNKITAPANGEATFSVKIELTAAGKQAYQDNFPNGSYVEGYTFLTADEGVSLSLPILGFYGDWDSLQVFQGTYDEGPANVTYSVLADVNASLSGNYVGVNNRTDAFARRWMGFGPARGGRTLVHQSSLLRNSEAYQITVKNAKGETMWDSGDLGAVRKTYITVTQTGYQATATLVQKGWNGRLPGADGSYNAGDWAPEGEYTFSVRGRGVGSDVDDYQSYTFYVDNTKPELKSAELFEDENGDLKLAVTVSDNKYLQFLWVIDSAQQYYYLEAADEFKDAEEGAAVRVVLDASDLVQQLSLNAANPGRVGILISDCANNTTTVFVDIGPQGVEIEPAEIAVGETKQLSYKVYPASMQDIDLEWSSSDESVATVNEKGEVTGVSDGTVRITATAFSRLSSYCMVTVGQGVPTERNFGECENLGEIFTTEDGLWWKVSGPDTVLLLPENNKTQNYSGSYSSMAEITVPATVSYAGKTYRVTAIAAEAFYFNMKTTSITLPDGLETIGGSAFFFASGIKTLHIPDSVKTIGAMAFNYVSNAALNIPASIEFIGDSAFSGSGVVGGDFPESLNYIGEKAFLNCTGLTTISLPTSVENYGANIFYGCSNVTYVELPQNMEKIPNGLLWNCTGLKRIYIPSSVREIGNAAFYGSGLEKLNLPDGLQKIDQWAFCSTKLKEIIIPDSVQTVEYRAFIYCDGVENCVVGSGVKEIGQDAFYFWNNKYEDQTGVMHAKTTEQAKLLRYSGYGHEILINGAPYTSYFGGQFAVDGISYMPTSDTTVRVTAISDDAKTETFSIPATVTSEGDGRTYAVTELADRLLFQNQSVLTMLDLPDTIEKTGDRTFDQMFNVRTFGKLPANLKSVGYQSFGYLGWERQLELNGQIPAWQTDVLDIPGSIEFMDQCAFAGNRYKTINVGEGITYLSYYALSGNKEATRINLPSTLTRLEESSVAFCDNATVNLPENLEYIGKQAFNGTPVGETITLPDNVSFVGDQAFGAYVYNADYTAQYWVGPTTIYLNGSLSNIGSNVFRPDAKVIAVLNSQRNMVAGFTDLDELPTVIWDGKTDIGYNDGSCIPEGVTVTLSGNVTIDGKLCIEGKLIVPHDAKLTITKDAVILGEDNIVYEGCKHEHTKEIVVEATCTEDGSKTVVCEDCGETLSTEVIPAKGHSFGDWTVTKEASCFEDGEESRTCSVCKHVETRPIFANSDNCPSKAFSDLDAKAWYHEGVDYALTNSLMNGVGGGKFEPDGQLTRAQLVTVLYRAAGEPDTGKQVNPFTDVADDTWYTKAVIWAANNGIVNGVGKNVFAPDASITREQIATMLYRYAGAEAAKEDKLSAFPDAAKVSDWAKEALNWAVASGLINGVADANGTASLEPQATATRAQIATILMRWLEK
jgi:lactocepin